MPGLSGDLFTLGAAAGFEDGLVSGRVGGDARGAVDLQAELCHGVELAAAADVAAAVEGALTLLLPAVRAQGEAFARAGLHAQLQLDPDLFERFGFTANLAAYAEASVAGRLAIGLDASALERLGRERLDGPPLQLFLAFLDELVLEAGVWAKASVAAMAQAYLALDGSITDPADAGFTFELGAAAGLAAGAGYDFFARARIEDPRRLVQRSVDLVTAALVEEARRALPREAEPAIALLDVALPVALQSAYELGRQAALGSFTTPEQVLGALADVVLAELQRFALDRAFEVAAAEVARLVDRAVFLGLPDELDAAGRAALRAAAELAIELLEQPALPPERLGELAAALIDVAAGVTGAAEPATRRPLATAWTAVALGYAGRGLLARAGGSVSAGVAGLTPVGGSGAAALALPPAPALVLAEYEAVLGRRLVAPTFADGVDYLLGVAVGPELELRAPAAWALLRDVAAALDVSPGDLVEAIVLGTQGQGLARTELYARLRDWLRGALEGVLLGELLPDLRAQADRPGRLLVDEVAGPSLRALLDFLFDRLDALAAGALDPADMSALTAGLSAVVHKLLARSLVTLQQILVEHVLAELERSFGELEQRVRGDAAAALVADMLTLARGLPGVGTLAASHAEAARELLADLLACGREMVGPSVWSPRRIERLREGELAVLLSLDGHVDYSAGAAGTGLAQLAECSFFPNQAACGEVFDLLLETTTDAFDVLLRRAVPAVGEFYLRITLTQAETLDEAVAGAADAIGALVDAALQLFNDLRAAADALHDEAVAAAERAQAELELAADQLRDPVLRQAVKDRLRTLGEETVRTLAAGRPDHEVAGALFGFAIAYDNPATQLLLDLALDAAATVGDGLAELLEGALDVDEAATRLADELAGAAAAVLPPDLVDPGLTGDDVATAIKEVLSTAALRGLLAQWLAEAQAAQAAADGEAAARAAQADAEADLIAREAQLDDVAAGPLAAAVLSPAPLADAADRGWIYGGVVPLEVQLSGDVRRTHVTPGPGRRVRIAVNTRALEPPGDGWDLDLGRGTLTLRMGLDGPAHGLLPGLNVLEVTVADGRGDVRRTAVAFLVDPAAPGLDTALAVDPARSAFLAPGRPAAGEHVALEWRGTQPLELSGWRVLDHDSRQKYVFRDGRLPPGGVLTLHTGGDPAADTATDVHWGRRAAAWNDRGDTVHVVDDRGVLRARHSYGVPR